MEEKDIQYFFDNVYHDRGLIKWRGYFLSDHTSKLHQTAAQQQQQSKLTLKKKMPAETIARHLSYSFRNHHKVIIQIAYYEGYNLCIKNLTGIVSGYENGLIILNNQEISDEEIISATLT